MIAPASAPGRQKRRSAARLEFFADRCKAMVIRHVARGALGALFLLLGTLREARLHAEPPRDEELRQAIQDLGHERFAVRQRALKLLEAAGERAEPLLRAAARSDVPEIERQARMLLERLIFRIAPDTPPPIADRLIRFHQERDRSAQQAQILRELLELGDSAHDHVLRLLDASSVDQRRWILDEFSRDNWRILASLVARGHDEIALDLMNEALEAQLLSITPHFVFAVAQRGQLDVWVSDFQKRLDRGGLAFDARVLTSLALHRGDLDRALNAARRANDPLLLRHVWIETEQWSELADSTAVRSLAPSTIGDWGLRLTALQRLGRQDEWTQELTLLDGVSFEPRGRGRPSRTSWNLAKILLLNEQTARALALLSKLGESRALVELKAARGDVREAWQLSEAAAQAEQGGRIATRLAHVEFLFRLGLKEQARTWLERLNTQRGEVPEPLWLESKIAWLIRLGMREEAKRLVCAASESSETRLGTLLAALEPRLGPDADICFRLLSQVDPESGLEQRLDRLHDLATERAERNDLERLVRQRVPITEVNGVKQYEAVARLVARWGLVQTAMDLLRDPAWHEAPAEALIWLGDTLFDHRHWAEAAAAYQRAWQRERTAPLPLFLYADATSRLNPQHPDVASRIQRSHRVPMGNLALRQSFYTSLRSRGFAGDALEELQTCYKLRDFGASSIIEMTDELARHHVRMGKPEEAVSLIQKNVLRIMPPSRGYVRYEAYLHLPATLRLLRAWALYRQGDGTAAQKEADLAESLSPLLTEIPWRLVPVLRQRGEHAAAERMLERFDERWQRIVEDFPDYAEAHHQRARLDLFLRQQAERALASARRAVELDPLNPTYHETLAEVLFQTGQPREALATILRCRRLPKADWHRCRRILDRYERGESALPILDE